MAEGKEDEVIRKIRPFTWELEVRKGKVVFYFYGLTRKAVRKRAHNYFNNY